VHSRPLARLFAFPLLLLLAAAPCWALSAADLPTTLPADPVVDRSEVLSRAASGDISRALDHLDQQGVAARLVTVPRLDYGLGLEQLGEQLLERWQVDTAGQPLLLLLIDTQTNGAAVIASPALRERLDPALVRSTARTTLAQPLRDGGRYRQASLDALQRLGAVLQGEPDPGEPATAEVVTPRTMVPTREETMASKAWVWVTVLLVVGTIVPMLTWWVFSR
jgi:uncharacterized protein